MINLLPRALRRALRIKTIEDFDITYSTTGYYICILNVSRSKPLYGVHPKAVNILVGKTGCLKLYMDNINDMGLDVCKGSYVFECASPKDTEEKYLRITTAVKQLLIEYRYTSLDTDTIPIFSSSAATIIDFITRKEKKLSAYNEYK